MNETGVVIGKFYPPHQGHKYLIDYATSRVQNLSVICCYRKGEQPDGGLRASWLREIHPNVKIISTEDTLPDNDSKGWALKTIELLGKNPDLVFTSEDYGDEYAEFMGAKHILVDKSRKEFPVSGTDVRGNPMEYWNYLEPAVKAWFAKRVCVVGAESTGTTTLAKSLAEYFNTVWVPEYGREYFEDKFDSDKAQSWKTEEFLHIAKVQAEMEDVFARSANRIVFCDTDAFATCIWHERYVGYPSQELEKFAATRDYELYLLTQDDIPFVQDGYRDGEHIRHWMHERFKQRLENNGIKHILLSGSHERRMNEAISYINKNIMA